MDGLPVKGSQLNTDRPVLGETLLSVTANRRPGRQQVAAVRPATAQQAAAAADSLRH